MKKKNILLIATTILGLTLIGCQSQSNNEPVQQETINEAEQISTTNQMEANAPKSDEVETNSTATSDATTEAATTAKDNATTATTKEDTSKTTDALTEDEAKAIALKDADIKEKDITNIRIKKDLDDGRTVYEVEFYVQNEEYDYEIDVNTGKIISKDYDIEDDFYNQTTTANGSDISQNEAIEIVLKRVPGATKQDVRIKLDVDDGHRIYEGEVYYNQTEYEFELSAADGKILEWSEEKEDD